jgi:hypothetical protein
MEKAVEKGNLDAASNLGRIFTIGMRDKNNRLIVFPNATKAFYNLNITIYND